MPAGSESGRFWFVVILLSAVALGLRLPNLNQSLWIDEAGSLAQATASDFTAASRGDVHPPLFGAMLRLGLKITPSIAVLRLFSVACGLGLLALAAIALRRSPAAVVVAGAIIVALPELVFHSSELRSYSLLYLLLAAALALSVSIADGSGGTRSRISLMLVLVGAAATHLVTVFFLFAIIPLVFWPVRGQGFRAGIFALLPLVPSGLLLLWFRFAFVTQPSDLAGGWWMPPASAATVWNSVLEVTGWNDVQWLAAACARRVAVAIWLVPAAAAGGLALSIWTAWGHRHGKPLALGLLVSALSYLGVIVVYSVWFEPVVMARTLVPALLPFIAGLAWGIGSHPVAWRRQFAAAAIVAYMTLAVLPTVRRSLTPIGGLRGLAAEIYSARRPEDAVVLFRSLDYGLAPYGVGSATTEILYFDQTAATEIRRAELRKRLAQIDPSARVLLAYREDYYYFEYRRVFDTVLADLATGGRTARVLWHENDLTLLVAAPK